MLVNICTIEEVQNNWKEWISKQFDESIDPRIIKKGLELIAEEVDYWADHSFWSLFDEVKLLIKD
jgi:hypothetical protein